MNQSDKLQENSDGIFLLLVEAIWKEVGQCFVHGGRNLEVIEFSTNFCL